MRTEALRCQETAEKEEGAPDAPLAEATPALDACAAGPEPHCDVYGATQVRAALGKAGWHMKPEETGIHVAVCFKRGEKECQMILAPIIGKEASAALGDSQDAAAGIAFSHFARSRSMVPFLRQVLSVVEERHRLSSYHLRVVPWFRGHGSQQGPSGRRVGRDQISAVLQSMISENVAGVHRLQAAARTAGFAVYCVGNNEHAKHVPILPGLDDLHAPISYVDATGSQIDVPGLTQRDVLVWDREDQPNSYTRSSLDWQGRPSVVTVMSPRAPASIAAAPDPVRRQSELSDVELAALWHDAGEAIEMHHGFEDCRLNAGTYQNLAHLHLKTFFKDADFLSVWGDSESFQKLRSARQERRASARAQAN